MSDLQTIKNIGPAFEEQLIAAGIADAHTLRSLGPDAAYAMLLAAGNKPHFIGYYVLVMALQGRPWNDCTGAEKEALRIKFDALKANRTQNDTGIERQLDAIGTGLIR